MKTLLDAAKKAFPGGAWTEDRGRIVDGNGYIFEIDDLGDQMALQIALEKEGWQFLWWNDEFQASQYETADPVVIAKQTKPELLLAIVRQGDS